MLISFDNIITGDPQGFAKRGYFSLIFSMFDRVCNIDNK